MCVVKIILDNEVVDAVGKLVARREYKTEHPLTGEKHNGKWVLRDELNHWVDSGYYLNDLLNIYPEAVVES